MKKRGQLEKETEIYNSSANWKPRKKLLTVQFKLKTEEVR